jgi:hypothetical protein
VLIAPDVGHLRHGEGRKKIRQKRGAERARDHILSLRTEVLADLAVRIDRFELDLTGFAQVRLESFVRI